MRVIHRSNSSPGSIFAAPGDCGGNGGDFEGGRREKG